MNTDLRFDAFDEKIKEITGVITGLMEIERVSVALDLQDDNDRKSINLIGVNSYGANDLPSV